MGGGSWSSSSYDTYTKNYRGMSSTDFAENTDFTAQSMYKSRHLASALSPKNIMRACHDCEEHPNTLPVILALDVTGSMGNAAMKVAQKLNDIMTTLYNDTSISDVEFCVMGIGDLSYDEAPIQMSQFESDIRIAEQLDKIYFEANGGGNNFESYTAAWYMGARHCDLDCWKRNQKGIIITLGDELPNPYLPCAPLNKVTGDKAQSDIETKTLYEEATDKFDIYHIAVKDKATSYNYYSTRYNIDEHWKELLGNHYIVATINSLAENITRIIKDKCNSDNVFVPTATSFTSLQVNENNEVTW